MSVAAALALAFAVTTALAVAALVATAVAWRRTRRQLTELRDSLRPVSREGAVEAVGRVARTVVQQAARLREQGLTQALSSSLDDLVQWAKADRDRIARVADRNGVVTLFFSDITDSTALNEELGDAAWVRVLAEHDRVVRREIESRDGFVVKTMGDGFMAVFGSAEAALRTALAVHAGLGGGSGRRLRRTPVAVRIGVHTGPAVSRGDDYLGRNVAICARIAARAGRAQTLASAETRRAAEGADGLAFVSLGPTVLKGISEPIEVFAVEADAGA